MLQLLVKVAQSASNCVALLPKTLTSLLQILLPVLEGGNLSSDFFLFRDVLFEFLKLHFEFLRRLRIVLYPSLQSILPRNLVVDFCQGL